MRALALLMLFAWPATLRAQPAPSEELRAEAHAAFDEGRMALERGDVDGGIEALERSLGLLPYLPTAYNLAVAHAEGGDPSRAANLVHAILAGDFGSLEASQRQEAERLLQGAAARTGRVIVHVDGAEAPWLEVDDEAVPVSLRQIATIYVRPGRHVFAVGADGVRAHRVALRLEPGASEELRVDLGAPPRGTLRVRSEDDRDPVAIVGVAEGPSPLEETVPVGIYEVGLLREPATNRSVRVDADRVRTILVEPPPKRWPRILGGALAALVAMGAAVAIGLAVRGGAGGPEDDPVFGTIEALRRP